MSPVHRVLNLAGVLLPFAGFLVAVALLWNTELVGATDLSLFAVLYLLTADFTFVNEAGLGLSLGAADYLTKPIDWSRLKRVLDHYRCGGQPEGPVLVVEDTSTTGSSVLTAVRAVRDAGATVVGVATVVDRDTGAREAIEARGLPYRHLLDLSDLGL